MKKEFKKQVFVGIIGVLCTSLVSAAFIVWGLGAHEWVRYVALAVLLAVFLGFLMYIFGGGKGFFSGAKYGLSFVALTAASKYLPVWLFGVFVIAAVVVLFALPLVKQFRHDREKSRYREINDSILSDSETEESAEDEMPEQNDELKDSIRFGEKSLILLAGTGGMYQLIRGTDRLYFLRVGGELSGMDVQLLRTDFSDESSYIENKKDFFIAMNNISEIKCKYGKVIGTERGNCGELKIKTYQKKYSFAILDKLPEKGIEAYFAGLPFAFTGRPKSKDAVTHVLTEQEKRVLPVLKTAGLALIIAAAVFSAAFIFLSVDPLIYRILSAFCILIPAVTFALYVKFKTLLSLDDSNNKTFKKSGVSIYVPLLFPCLALAIRTFSDFDILGWESLLTWSGAIIAIVLLILFTLTKEYKRKKSVILVIVLAVVFYAPSVVIQVNCLYDYSTPVVGETALLDKYMSNSKSGKFYYFTVELKEGIEKDLKVTREFYEQRSKGSIVTVNEKQGLLGIDYVYIDEGE